MAAASFVGAFRHVGTDRYRGKPLSPLPQATEQNAASPETDDGHHFLLLEDARRLVFLLGFAGTDAVMDATRVDAGLYLARAAEKAPKAAERQRLRDLSQEILVRARSQDGLWGTFSPEMRADLEPQGQICADLFQRSSSCVEGRNGQFSLKHYALHRFTLRTLQAQTVLHNCLARRPDGTTAAERFHETAPQDLFGWLLNRLAVPPVRVAVAGLRSTP